MYGEWRKNKTVLFINSGLKAEFSTYYEDQRDIMCDSVRPEWGVSSRKDNRHVVIRDGRGDLFSEYVDRDRGNEMYRDIVELSKGWNPYKQRYEVEAWVANGGRFADGQRERVIQNQLH